MPLDLMKRSETTQPITQAQNDGNITAIESFVNGLEASLATKAASAHTHPSTDIADSTPAGRALMTAADAAAQRTLLGLGALATKASVATTDVANNAVTLAKLQTVSSPRLLGRSTIGAGNVEEISIGSGLSLTGGTLAATGGGTGGNITASQITDSTAAGRAILTATDAAAQRTLLGLGALATKSTIGNADVDTAAAIALSKLQTISTARILGRSTGGTGAIEQLSLGTGLSLSGGVLSATGGGTGTFDQNTAYTIHSGGAGEQARSTKARFSERMLRITDFIAAGATSVNQAVTDALAELGTNRGVIWFPRGTYTISGGGITVASKTGIRLITDHGATLQASAGVAANKNVVGMGMVYLLLQQCTDCWVEGFDIDCNTNDGGGLGLDRCVGTTLLGCTVRRSNHLTFSSIQAAGGQDYMRPNRILQCRVLGNGLVGNDTRGMMIGHYDSAATLENGIEVAGCTIENCNATGMVLVGHRQNVHHNFVRNTGGSGIIFSGNLTFWCEGTRCHHNDVNNNLFQGLQGDHYNGAVSHGVEILGNKVWGNKTAGIYLWRMQGTSVVGNTCWNNNADNNILVGGIHVVESTQMTISGNSCFDNQTTRTQTAGILVEANDLNSTDIMIGNNIAYNNKQFGIYAQQVGTGRIDRIAIVGNMVRANDQGTTSYGIRGESNTAGNVTSGLISQNVSTGHDTNTSTVGTGWTTANNI